MPNRNWKRAFEEALSSEPLTNSVQNGEEIALEDLKKRVKEIANKRQNFDATDNVIYKYVYAKLWWHSLPGNPITLNDGNIYGITRPKIKYLLLNGINGGGIEKAEKEEIEKDLHPRDAIIKALDGSKPLSLSEIIGKLINDNKITLEKNTYTYFKEELENLKEGKWVERGNKKIRVKEDKEKKYFVEIQEDPDAGWKQLIMKMGIPQGKPNHFQKLVADLLKKMGYEEVAETSHSGDGGIDIRCVWPLNSLKGGEGPCDIPVGVQVKRWELKNGNIPETPYFGPKEVRELRGSLTEQEEGVFITTYKFTSRAKEAAEKPGYKRIKLIDGEKLANLFAKHELLDDVDADTDS